MIVTSTCLPHGSARDRSMRQGMGACKHGAAVVRDQTTAYVPSWRAAPNMALPKVGGSTVPERVAAVLPVCVVMAGAYRVLEP